MKRNSTTLVNETKTASIRVNEEGNYTCQAASKHGIDKRDFVVVNGKDTRVISFKLFLVGATVNVTIVSDRVSESQKHDYIHRKVVRAEIAFGIIILKCAISVLMISGLDLLSIEGTPLFHQVR